MPGRTQRQVERLIGRRAESDLGSTRLGNLAPEHRHFEPHQREA
jgi:hypothetical protein